MNTRSPRWVQQLDTPPTPSKRAVLEQLVSGREIALDPQGRPHITQTGQRVARVTIDALIARHWITGAPDLPLFGMLVTLTERGQRALRLRHRNH